MNIEYKDNSVNITSIEFSFKDINLDRKSKYDLSLDENSFDYSNNVCRYITDNSYDITRLIHRVKYE